MTSGFRTFTAGEVLTASNVQNYLMDQSVMTFAGSAARSSAIGTANFEEGMTSYLKDTDKLEVYDGTNWVGVAPTTTQGLTLINTTSFSGVASQAFNNVFSATYNNYRIKINFDNTGTTPSFYIKLRASGTDSSVNYWSGLVGRTSTNTSATDGQQDVTVGFIVGFSANANSNHMAVFDLDNPFLTKRTTFAGSYVDQSAVVGMHFAGSHRNTGSFDGFNFIASTGNLTNATVSIYGYNK